MMTFIIPMLLSNNITLNRSGMIRPEGIVRCGKGQGWSGVVVMVIKLSAFIILTLSNNITPNRSGMIRPEGIVRCGKGQGWSGVVVMVIKCVCVHNPHVKKQYHTQSQWDDMSGRDCQMW